MENFIFQNTTKIIFGKGTHKEIGEEIKKFTSKILLHYGGGSVKKSGVYDEIIQDLNAAGVEIIELGGVKPNPRLSLVREGIEICQKNSIDFILAVGGGSVIDSSKAIALGVHYEGDVWDFFKTDRVPEEVLPIGVILTIPASGSESSNGTVITNEDGWYKRATSSYKLIPKFAVLNPELTYTLPTYQTFCGVSDIMAHVMERYFTNAIDTDLTDRLSEATLKTVINNAYVLSEHPKDYAARAEIMWAGTIAHNNLLGTGRIDDWASHNIEHEISGIYDVAHGAGLSVIFPAWMQYVYKFNVNRFVQFAVRVWNIDLAYSDPKRIALLGIQKTKSFFSEIGLPISLKELKIPEDRLEEMAAKATESGPVGNLVKLYKNDVLEILKLAF
jgi:alcohol dehydrogenase YqhD (iron-dependent ADH family)